MPYLIDSHAHVNFPVFDADRKDVLARSLESGIWVVNVGSDQQSSTAAVTLAHKYDEGVYAIVGLHPTDIGRPVDFDSFKTLAADPKVVAIGEIGLDYHHFEEGDDIESLKAKQKEILIKFIEIASEVGKPVMLHCWDGYGDLLEILDKYPVARRGIVHSFVGGFRTARKFIELGYSIGINGVVTYTPDFDRLLKEIPLEKLVVETDCPYLAPGARKGERNEPVEVRAVAAHIAQIKGLPLDTVAEQTTANARLIYGI